MEDRHLPADGQGARVLLIDDDRKLARLLAQYLGAQGFEVTAVHDGTSGLQQARAARWDLILLDVMLPQMDGFELLGRLRETSTVPVLMLTARGTENDRISGLDRGADDYLPKTASARELAARIRSLLRRAAITQTRSPPDEPIRVGDLSVDPGSRTAMMAGRELTLTPVEFDLLLTLARHAGRVCSREQLVEQLRDRRFSKFDRSVDVHIASLRRKLGDDPRAPRFIRTLRAAGYLLVDPRSDSR